jgi:hypothetical protein
MLTVLYLCNKSIYLMFIFTIFFYFLLTVSSHAYLDPGTGSIILQLIIGFIAAISSWCFLFWSKIKLMIFKLKTYLIKKKNIIIDKWK